MKPRVVVLSPLTVIALLLLVAPLCAVGGWLLGVW